MVGLHVHLRDGLAVLDIGGISGGAAHDHGLKHLVHVALQLCVDPALVDLREIAQVHALQGGGINLSHQILVNLLGHEGDHGGGGFGHGHQGGVQRHIGVDLVLLHTLGPETVAASAHVPVAHVVHELLEGSGSLGDHVVVQVGIHGLYHGIHLGQEPFIHHGQLVVLQGVIHGVEAVDIGVQYPEGVGVPQGSHELALSLGHGLVLVALGQPGGAAGVEEPADGVGPVGLQGIEGIHRVALGLTHLLSVLVQHQAHNHHVLVGGLVEQQGGLGKQRVEPAPGLVHGLGNELGRELGLEQLLVLKGIMVLGEGHSAGVEPAVDHLGHPLHLLSAAGAGDGHGVDVGAVQLDLLRTVVGHALQLLDAADGVLVSALALPDI